MIQRAIGHVKNFQTQESLHKMSTSIQNRANLKAKPTGNVYTKHLYSVSHQQLHGEQSQRTPPALLLFSLFSLLMACCAYIFCNKITNSSVSLDCIEWKKGQNPNSSMFNCHRQKLINMGPCWYYRAGIFFFLWLNSSCTSQECRFHFDDFVQISVKLYQPLNCGWDCFYSNKIIKSQEMQVFFSIDQIYL